MEPMPDKLSDGRYVEKEETQTSNHMSAVYKRGTDRKYYMFL